MGIPGRVRKIRSLSCKTKGNMCLFCTRAKGGNPKSGAVLIAARVLGMRRADLAPQALLLLYSSFYGHDTLISLVNSSLSADSTYLNSQVHILWDE